MIFAIIDKQTGIVQNVIVAEESYRARLVQIFDPREVISSGNAKQSETAAIGFYYNKQGRYFVPFPSWSVDQQGNYKPPVAYPNDGFTYVWDESVKNWIKVN